jgi:hypothetical protein
MVLTNDRDYCTKQVGRLNCCWPSPAQSFLALVSSTSVTEIFVPSKTCTCFEMGPPLRRRRGRSSFVGAMLLHRSFSTSISALLRRPNHYGLCASFVTAVYKVTVIQVIQRFPVNEGFCSRLYFNLCNYSETAVNQLNGRRPHRRQV